MKPSKLVKESLNEFHKGGDPLKNLGLGVDLPNVIHVDNDTDVTMYWDRMEGEVLFDLDVWPSRDQAKKDINGWMNGNNGLCKDVDDALANYGVAIVYGKGAMSAVSEDGWDYNVMFKIRPI